MPGIFGSVGPRAGGIAAGLAQALTHGPAFEVIETPAPGIFCGGVSRRKGSTGIHAPYRCPASGHLVLFQGRLFLSGGNAPLSSAEAHRTILDAYEAHGLDFPHRLHGHFAVALWDAKAQRLVAAVDTFANHDLYYCCHDNTLSFAPECKALWKAAVDAVSMDETAAAEFLYFGYPLLDRTLATQSKMLTPGAALCWQDGSVRVYRPTPWPFPKARHRAGFDDASATLADLMDAAVKRQVDADDRVLLPLSGGMDSRYVAASIRGITPPPLCVTYGGGACEETKIAKTICAMLGFPQHVLPYETALFPAISHLLTYLCDGMTCLQSGMDIGLCGRFTPQATVSLNGFFGDRIAGVALNKSLVDAGESGAPAALEPLIAYCLKKHRTLPAFQSLEDYGLNPNTAMEGMIADIERALQPALDSDCSRAEAAEYFDMTQRQTRFIARGFNIIRYYCEHRCPFADRDLLQFVLSLPAACRMDYGIYLDAFTRLAPDLAAIRYFGTRVPVTRYWWTPYAKEGRRFYHYAKFAVRRSVEIASAGRVNPKLSRYYAHYDAWLREAWRGWAAEELAQGVKTLGWKQDSVQRLYDAHMRGRHNYSWPILAAITLKQWHGMYAQAELPEALDIDGSLAAIRGGE